MWKNLAKHASSPKLRDFFHSAGSLDSPRRVVPCGYISQIPTSFFPQSSVLCVPGFGCSARLTFLSTVQCGFSCNYGAAAEAVVYEEESASSGSDEVGEILHQMCEQEKDFGFNGGRKMMMKKKEQLPGQMIAGMSAAKYHALKRRQIMMETEAWEEAAKEYQELLADMCEQKLAPNLPYVKSLFLGWFEPLRDAIAVDQEECQTRKQKPSHAPFFNYLPADMMAVITMHKLMGLLMMANGSNGYCRVIQAACQIGEAIEHEAMLHNFLENTKKNGAKHQDAVDETDPLRSDDVQEDTLKAKQEKLRKKVTKLMKKQKVLQVREIVKEQDESIPWGQENHVKVGSRLIQLLMETAYIQPPVDQLGDAPPDIRPAFVHTLKNITKDAQKGSRRYGVIECDPLVHKGLEKSARHIVIPYMPMLVPPMNWTGYAKGAYFFLPSYMMRTHGAKQQRETVKRTSVAQFEPVFEALNTLGNTKWRINKRVLAVIDRIWASGGCLGGLVDCEDVLLPEKPETDVESELRKWRWKVKNLKKENLEKHSQRCDVELKLAVARKMKDEEGFYYPHNLDFRGRAYPMHPHLNHLGSDLCRGILEFAEGRPLGQSGLHWLKIHLTNLFGGGVDKLSYDGGIAFTENHLDDIFDSVDRPLEGRRWWLKAEDSFQCLAVSMDLAEALRSSSPESSLSHMPVHQLGAAAVNLVAGDKPADVYSGIAARVLDIMRRDAGKDPTTCTDVLHARRLIHQTVMTSVYGVTYIGARDQIKRRLKERDAIADDTELFTASCYAARTTLTALGDV